MVIGWLVFSVAGWAQNDNWHGRKYQPPPPTAHIVVTVEKHYNDHAMPNVAVVFHAEKDGHKTGNMELKTDSNGQAIMDLIEAGSHVTIQVLANGFATDAEEFNVGTGEKDVLVKLLSPREQLSSFENNKGKAAVVQPGVQVHVAPKPAPKPAQTPAPPAAPAAAPQQPKQ
jgi:hypothetical protein